MKILKRILLSLLILIVIVAIFIAIPVSAPEDDFMSTHFSKIEAYINEREAQDTTVSQANVAWHLDHILKTINQIHGSVQNSDPNTYESSFSFVSEMVFLMGDFPRGVAQSPASLRPPEVILTEDIYTQLAESKERMAKIKQMDEDLYFEHPVFGDLKRNKAMRFIQIHTEHHFKIIEDILAK